MRLQDPTSLPQDPRVANAPMYVPVEIYRLLVSNAREHESKINAEHCWKCDDSDKWPWQWHEISWRCRDCTLLFLTSTSHLRWLPGLDASNFSFSAARFMFPTVWVLPSAWGNNYGHETKTHFMFCLRFVSRCAVRWDGGNTWTGELMTLRRSSPSVRKSALPTRFQFCEFDTRCGLTNHKRIAKIEFRSMEAGVCFSVPDATCYITAKSTAAILRSCQTRLWMNRIFKSIKLWII